MTREINKSKISRLVPSIIICLYLGNDLVEKDRSVHMVKSLMAWFLRVRISCHGRHLHLVRWKLLAVANSKI